LGCLDQTGAKRSEEWSGKPRWDGIVGEEREWRRGVEAQGDANKEQEKLPGLVGREKREAKKVASGRLRGKKGETWVGG